jgi:type I restriction enzyme S subunit
MDGKMGLKYFGTQLRDVASNRNLRLDFRLLEFAQKSDLLKSYEPFRRNLLSISNGKDIGKENYVAYNTSDLIYPTVNNFKNGIVDLSSVTFVNDSYLDEFLRTLKTDDIIISRSGTVGLTFVWDEKNINQLFKRQITAIPSGYLIVVTVNKEKLLPKFIEYYFTTDLMKQYFNVYGVGKSQKNIAQPEILSIPVPQISITDQQKILEQASPLEKEVEKLKAQIKPDSEIINQVFANSFSLNLEAIKSLKQEFTYQLKFSQLDCSKDFRSTVKFHSKKYDFLKNPIFNIHKVRDFAKFMTLGRQITPEDFADESEYYYLLPDCIKNFYLEEDLLRPIKEDFFSTYKHIALKPNDIVIAASGEGTIGKSAIYTSDKECIISQFVMKIEMNDNINLHYFHYYLQTIFFQLIVEKFKKGMGNMTNIFVYQVEKFPVLFNPKLQDEIVNQIQVSIYQQRNIEREIKTKKQIISYLIEKAITAS